MPKDQIPIQPVENPIFRPPCAEPGQHWLYDTKTGIPTKTPGRHGEFAATRSVWPKVLRSSSPREMRADFARSAQT